MRFMVLLRSTSEPRPHADARASIAHFNDELLNAGALLAGEALGPDSAGARVRFSGTRRTVSAGAAAAGEAAATAHGSGGFVTGFWLLELRSLEEAIEWVKRMPNPVAEESEVEIRPVVDAALPGEEAPRSTPTLDDREAEPRR